MPDLDTDRKETEVGVDAARDTLTDICDRVALLGERYVVTRNGKARVAIVPIKDLERLRVTDAAA